MLRPWFALAFAGVVIVLSLLLFAISLLIAALCAGAVAVVSPFRRGRRLINAAARNAWAADEFGFEHAIESYEQLIDAHAWRRP